MDQRTMLEKVAECSRLFAGQRGERQLRRALDRQDFDALHEAGLPLVGLPADCGGLWESAAASTRMICAALRTLARGDSSVALVCAMHPAVLSYWLTAPPEAHGDDWQAQCDFIFQSLRDGHWWGTITSEPGSGGDILRTKTIARRGSSPLEYLLTGQKHFGSGSGVTSFMVTTALPEDSGEPDWFFVDLRSVTWDGSQGVELLAEWDGHGMAATQSHAVRLADFRATRIAWSGHLNDIAARTGGFIGCLFTSVIVGIIDVAMNTARNRLDSTQLAPFESVEWTRARMESWLIAQSYEGMLRAVEQQHDPRRDVLYGKTNIAELAESVMTRLCKVIGGGTFARSSPFGFWFEDVRALGFLRPPWGLAFQTLIDGLPAERGN